MPGSFPDFNLYDELEVSAHASAEVIDVAYHRLARMYHPDTNPGSDSSRMVRLNLAYEVLSDLQSRKEYDGWLSARGPGSNGTRAGQHSAPETPRAAPSPQPSPLDTSSTAARWWKNNQGWVIGLAITLAIGLISGYGRSQTARDSIRSQNDAARASTSPASGSASGSRSAFTLRVGDCISDALPTTAEPVGTVHGTPCSNLDARWQVSSSFVVGSASSYPPASYFGGLASGKCSSAASFLYPTSESWAEGDRTVSCLRRVSASTQSSPSNPPAPNSPPGTTTGASQTPAPARSTSAPTPSTGTPAVTALPPFPTVAPTAVPPSMSANPFGNGRFIVGSQVAPGTYQTTAALAYCLVGHDGSTTNISASVGGTLTIVVQSTWSDISSANCGTWYPISQTSQNSFGNGRFIVGSQVAPGTYQTTAALAYCLVGHDGSTTNISASVGGTLTIVVQAAWRDISSANCGTWVRLG